MLNTTIKIDRFNDESFLVEVIEYYDGHICLSDIIRFFENDIEIANNVFYFYFPQNECYNDIFTETYDEMLRTTKVKDLKKQISIIKLQG